MIKNQKIRKTILKRMIDMDVSGAQITRSLGLTRTMVTHVLAGRTRSKRVREAICAALNLPYSIWDEMDRPRKAA
jgi:cyanate lyase